MSLITVEAAQARLLAAIAPLDPETVPLLAACGRRAAADHVATRTQPPFAASAMDGYAIRWDDRAGPWTVIGEAAAGRRFGSVVRASEAVRIFTGAPLADGADTVIVQEDVVRDGDHLHLTGEGPPARGAHIRVAGLDFVTGAVLVASGTTLTPARLGLLAAGGHGAAAVHRQPVVGLLATGDELVPPGTTPGPDQIVSSNGVMLAALLTDAGARVIDGGIVRDDPAALQAAIAALAHADLIVTIGGASVGDHDLVLPSLRALGAEIDFWKVALRPGKPMLAGRLGSAHVVGLPGNPVSAFVCAQLFIVPMLRSWSGSGTPMPLLRTARLGVGLAANGARRDYLRATLVDGSIVPASRQDSGMLQVLADANALLVRAPGAAAVDAGAIVEFLQLDTRSDVA